MQNESKQMKPQEILEAINSGKVIAHVEFRSGETARISGTSAKNGKAYDMRRAKMNVELGDEPLVLEVDLPEDGPLDPATGNPVYKFPAKGEKIIVAFEPTPATDRNGAPIRGSFKLNPSILKGAA